MFWAVSHLCGVGILTTMAQVVKWHGHVLQASSALSDTPSRQEVTTLERRAISITQACESVGVSRRTIYNWMAAGKVQYVRTAGGAVRIFEDTLWRAPQAAEELASLSADDQQA
jgi:excisionase family DNA binding protein